jgi:hypothetical protein
MAFLLRVSIVRQLLDVMHQTEQLPLCIDLLLSAKREPVEPLVVADVREYPRLFEYYRRQELIALAGTVCLPWRPDE